MFDINKPEQIAYSDSRNIIYRWPIREIDEQKTEYAELSVTHHKRGANYFTGTQVGSDYFSVTLRNVTVELKPGLGTMTAYSLFDGLGLTSIHAGNRYSRKKLVDAAEKALAEFHQLYKAGDPKVLAYFEPKTEEVAA